jgi:hypothetical protein
MYWAYGERDVNSIQIDQNHFKAKGSRSIYLLNPSFKKTKEENLYHWDVQMKNVSITIKNKKHGYFAAFNSININSKTHFHRLI